MNESIEFLARAGCLRSRSGSSRQKEPVKGICIAPLLMY